MSPDEPIQSRPPPLRVALFEPEIPGNAAAVGRVCAATGLPLHLIGRLGFSFSHPSARRAGMDYLEQVERQHHLNLDDFAEAVDGRIIAFTTRADRLLWDFDFETGDTLLFGPESRGLPDAVLEHPCDARIRIPMLPAARSLNLATSVSIGVYEALRQLPSTVRPVFRASL